MPYEQFAIEVLPYYGSAILMIAWFTSIIWTYRDMRSRSRDTWARFFAAAFVGLFNLPGLLIYWSLRPSETLGAAYARSLEEEALLQEIERTVSCPNCAAATERNWQICPLCHSQLRRRCHSCDTMLELDWTRCPACLSVQTDTHVPKNTDIAIHGQATETANISWEDDEASDYAAYAPQNHKPAWLQSSQDQDDDYRELEPSYSYTLRDNPNNGENAY